jgi:hypothetical protein
MRAHNLPKFALKFGRAGFLRRRRALCFKSSPGPDPTLVTLLPVFGPGCGFSAAVPHAGLSFFYRTQCEKDDLLNPGKKPAPLDQTREQYENIVNFQWMNMGPAPQNQVHVIFHDPTHLVPCIPLKP